MALHDFKSQRLFVKDDLLAQVRIETSRAQANYLLNVLRMKEGEKILVFNGKDGEWSAQLAMQGRKNCTLLIDFKTRPQPQPYGLVYCFAPLKQARLDYVIQKAVEMGTGEIYPIITQFTQVRSVNQQRMWKNAVEASEQCGILCLPTIHEPVHFKNLNNIIGPDLPLVFCDENAHDANELDTLARLSPKRVAVLIGPEGGFSSKEREFLQAQKNTHRLGLGPRILRADTAMVAALAIIQSTLGDWYIPNDPR